MTRISYTAPPVPTVGRDEIAPDPHGAFARLRRETPAIRIEDGRVLVLRAADVARLNTDPRTIQMPGAGFADVQGVPAGRARRFLEMIMLLANGADHRRRRGPFVRAFSFAAIRERRPLIRETARRIMDGIPRDEEFEFGDLVAARIPAEMIARLLGLPPADAEWFRRNVYLLARTLSTVYPAAIHDEVEGAARALYDCLASELRGRRASPRDDLLTRLVETADELGEEETVTQLMGVLLAGSDTTRTAFASLVDLLIAEDAWSAVRADRTLIPAAINEAMRLEPSVGALPRLTTEPLRLDPYVLPRNTRLVLSTLSALRDPDLYDDPQRFDLTRTHPKLHPIFGGGPHRCLGEMLARLELEEALDALLDTAPTLGVTARPNYLGIGGIRGMTPMMACLR